jgi:hypothetical protein
MISIARTLGAPDKVPAGKRARKASIASKPGATDPDVRDEMHDVRVALDDELLGHLDRAGNRDAADVVATEIEEHDVLGALLGIGEQAAASSRLLRAWRPRQCVPAIGRTVITPSSRRTMTSATPPPRTRRRARGGRGTARVDRAQAAVDVERLRRGRAGEALREHDLDDVARADVVARARHGGAEALLALVDSGSAFRPPRNARAAAATDRRALRQLLDAEHGGAIGGFRRRRRRQVGMGDDERLLSLTVEDDERVDQEEAKIGAAEVVGGGAGSRRSIARRP